MKKGFRRVGEGLAGVAFEWIEDEEARLELLRRLWPRVAGEQVARRAEPAGYDDGVLEVRVVDEEWRSNLEGLEGEVRGRLNRALGGRRVRRIVWT